MTAGVFTFEAQGADLKLLPLAARRALDVSGWKLSLAGWTSLSQFDRHALVAYGTAERIDTSAVEALVRLATPSATPIDASIEGALEECDDRAARLLHPYRVLASAWPGLSRLSRFALRHLAKRGDAERLAVAFDEVVGRALQLTHLDSQQARDQRGRQRAALAVQALGVARRHLARHCSARADRPRRRGSR